MVLEGTEISRDHAEIRIDGSIVTIDDLYSRNGTFVNGVRTHSARLENGSVIRCGEWVGVLLSCPADGGEEPTYFGKVAPGLLGGTKLRKALAPAKKIAAALHVIVQGQTGTGKEGAARAVHEWGGRSGELIAVNCAAIPESLADAELFGHSAGAFTGAVARREGLFVAASGGSLFLDEVLELPLPVQAKLLRVIDQGTIRRLGESRDMPVSVRVIAAAQRPLEDAVEEGRFRADLYARLNGLTLVLPPLSERREDVLPLFWHFLRAQPGGATLRMEAKFAEALCSYHWPRNVRELRALALQMAQLHGDEGLLRKAHLPEALWPRAMDSASSRDPGASGEEPAGPAPARARKSTRDPVEFQRLVAALGVHGTVARAAAAVGITLQRANRLLAAHPEYSREKKGR